MSAKERAIAFMNDPVSHPDGNVGTLVEMLQAHARAAVATYKRRRKEFPLAKEEDIMKLAQIDLRGRGRR